MSLPLFDEKYPAFGKIPRLHKPVVVTEKIDGSNGLIAIADVTDMAVTDLAPGAVFLTGDDGREYLIRAGSRKRWITPEMDNFGFASWVHKNSAELLKLGVGHHYGEWYGVGIQRNYGLLGRRFALFNVKKWADNPDRPACCEVVPVLGHLEAEHLNVHVSMCLAELRLHGSKAVPGFGNPEGIVIYHSAANTLFKVLLENDDKPKSITLAA